MAQVNTVLGPISPDQMGTTLMHEHIIFNTPGWEYSPEAFQALDAPRVFEKLCGDLMDFKSLGGRTLVDVSGVGLGRDVELFADLSRATGVHIVCCTGFWAERKILPYFAERDIDYHTELYVRELTQGVGTTNIKAGIIKVGNSRDSITPLEEMTFRAGARASKRTGAVVTTHGVRCAEQQLSILLSEGIEPSRTIIGHLDDRSAIDLERDKRMARKGVWLSYDHIGTEEWSTQYYAMPDEKRVELVVHIAQDGFINQMLLSNDTNGWSCGLVHRGTPEHTYAHLLRHFVPKLLKAGLTEKQIHTLLVENPRKVLPF
ncbi:MAG: phosphotriesterase [Deltaproteobacteria bacterium]|nr:phosphotriesterase [Deltaproteobacteria bacterium]